MTQGSYRLAVKVCNDAQQFLLLHIIAPTPSYYSVVYCYLTKENLALNHKIDKQLAAYKPLDNVFLDALFTEFLSNTQLIEDKIITPIGETLSSTLAQLDSQVSSEKEAISNLNNIGKALGRLGDYKPLQNIKTFLLNAIGQSQTQHKSLSNELHKASQEVSQLKQKLEPLKYMTQN